MNILIIEYLELDGEVKTRLIEISEKESKKDLFDIGRKYLYQYYHPGRLQNVTHYKIDSSDIFNIFDGKIKNY